MVRMSMCEGEFWACFDDVIPIIAIYEIYVKSDVILKNVCHNMVKYA